MPTEAETRQFLIDHQLARAGWDVSKPRQVITELALRFPTSSGIVSGGGASCTTEFADYALLDSVGLPGRGVAILKRLLRPGGTITVIEGDHGSTCFYPDSPAVHAAIQCRVKMQREAGGNSAGEESDGSGWQADGSPK